MNPKKVNLVRVGIVGMTTTVALAVSANAIVVVLYDFNAGSQISTDADPNSSASSLMHFGLAPSLGENVAYGYSDLKHHFIFQPTDKYFAFTLTPTVPITLAAISLRAGPNTRAAGTDGHLRLSIVDPASNSETTIVSDAPFDTVFNFASAATFAFAGPSYEKIATPRELRFYLRDEGASNRWRNAFQLDDVTLTGHYAQAIPPIPEPTTALFAFALIGAAAMCRRRYVQG